MRRAMRVSFSLVFLLNFLLLSSSLSIADINLDSQAGLKTNTSADIVSPQVIIVTAVETTKPVFIGQTTARLSGRISLDQAYLTVGYYFEFGRTASYTEKTQVEAIRGENTSTENVVSLIEGLECNTNYHFRLVTELTGDDNITSTILGDDYVFKTMECNGIEIFLTHIISGTQNSVSISSSINAGGLEAEIYFTYGDTVEMVSATTPIVQTGASIRENLTGLECGKKYFYQMHVSTIRDSVATEVLSFDMLVCPQLPSLNYLDPIDIQEDTATLMVAVVPNGARTYVTFEYGATREFGIATGSISILENVDKREVAVPILDLLCATHYFFRVTISNDVGSVEGRTQDFVTAACPEKPVETAPELPRVFSGKNHSVAIGMAGELVSWGSNEFRQLGRLTDGVDVADVILETIEVDQDVLFDFKAASVGSSHSLLLHSTGRIAAFGNSEDGRTGVLNADAVVPVPTGLLDADRSLIVNAIAVAAGGRHSVAVADDGRVWAWGDNSFGQLGNDVVESSSVATYIDGINDVADISAGKNFTVAIRKNNTLISWGENDAGQLGNGNTETQFSPVVVSNVNNIELVSAGAKHVLALNSNGFVLVWGGNENGQLGLGDTDNRFEASLINNNQLVDVIALAAGENHSLALLSDGTVLGWGDNTFNQLKEGEGAIFLSPTVLIDASDDPLNKVIAISAGDNFSVVIFDNGKILSFGDNSKGQLNGRSSVDVARATLTNKSNTQINMVQPRIIVSDNNIRVKEDETATLTVWLTQNPEQRLTVASRLSVGDGVEITQGQTLDFFSNDWFKKRTITIKAGSGGATLDDLFLESSGLGSAKVGIIIQKSNAKSTRLSGAVIQFYSLITLLLFLLYTRISIRNRFIK